MKFLYLTDVHGNLGVYRKALKLAEKKDIENIVFGGDSTPNKIALVFRDVFFLLPFGEWYKRRKGIENEGYIVEHDGRDASKISDIELTVMAHSLMSRYADKQAAYVEKLAGLFEKARHKNIYIMPGNDDAKKILNVYNALQKQGIRQMHNRKHEIGGLDIFGYAFVNPTPFFLKDWEKSEKEIAGDLEKLAKGIKPEKTIMAFHAPPKNTALDVLHDRSHAGSLAIRRFIEKYQPLIALHGHIHESPEMSNEISCMLGRTLCVNPGSSNAKMRAVIVDTEKLTVNKVSK